MGTMGIGRFDRVARAGTSCGDLPWTEPLIEEPTHAPDAYRVRSIRRF